MVSEPRAKLAGWFDELRGPLRRFLALRRGIPSCDVEDLAQEVFLRLLRYDRAELVTDPKAYLFKVASNVASEWCMGSRQRLPHDAGAPVEAPSSIGPEDEWEAHAREVALSAALQRLSPRAREVLRLHFHEELTYEAIAGRMQISRRMVKRDVIRAYSALRAALEPERPVTRSKRAANES